MGMKIVNSLLVCHVLWLPCAMAESLHILLSVPLPGRGEISDDLRRGSELGPYLAKDDCKQWSATKEINFKFSYALDGPNKTTAEAVARQAVEQRAQAVVGHFNSGTALPASAIYEVANIPNVSTGATNPKLTSRNFKMAFRLVHDDLELSRLQADQLADKWVSPILAVDDGTAYGQYVIDGFLQSAAVNKAVSQVSRISIPFDRVASNKDRFLNHMKQAGTLVIGGMDAFAIELLESLPNQQTPIVIGGDGLCSQAMAEKFADRYKGKMFCASQSMAEVEIPYGPWRSTDMGVRYQKQFGQAMSLEAARAADASALMIKAMCATQSLDGTKIAEHLRSPKVFEGLSGPIRFRADGSNEWATGFLYVMGGGQWQLLNVIGARGLNRQ